MEQTEFIVPATLKARFTQFQHNPIEHFRVGVRQMRAQQLRQLLSDPAAISLELFNREVWPIGKMVVNGQQIGDLLGEEARINLSQLPELTAALDDGRLEIHGNSIWGSAAQIYGARLRENEQEKVQFIRQALTILNTAELSPIEKAKRIDQIPGFGLNSATGLVMVFHPTEFAIYNQVSKSALQKLGYPAEDLQTFEGSARLLKEQLEAADYIELDWFLYLLNEGCISVQPPQHVWWVNQGASFAVEKAGGYLWAPKHGRNGATYEHWTNLTKLQPGDVVLHYANGVLRAVSQVVEAAQEAPRPEGLPSNAWEKEGYLVRVQYQLLQQPIQLQDIPVEWRLEEPGPFTKEGGVKQGYLFPVSDEFANKLQDRFRSNLPPIFHAKNSQRQTWLFQRNPKIHDLAAQVKKVTVGATDDWLVTAHRKEMHSGDRVVLWEAGPEGGIVALGELTGEPFQREPSPWRPGRHTEPEWAVPYRFTHILKKPISRSELLADPILRNMHHLRFAQGTNYKVTAEEWEALEPLLNQQSLVREVPSVPYALPIRFAELYQSILSKGLFFSPQVVANYLLALQTKRFVILTGISGTGKTQLALAVAQCFSWTATPPSSTIPQSFSNQRVPHDNGAYSQLYRLVAVKPDWRDNRGLLGYYNPLMERYAVTPALRLLLDAEKEFALAAQEGREPSPFFLILDEMNLARVEHYFSDFLSCLESGVPIDLQDHPSAGVDDTEETLSVPAQLAIHNNVFITGTVNIDETTYMFSPKVLDRAFTMELNEVNLAALGQREPLSGVDSNTLYLHHFPGQLQYTHKPNSLDWEEFGRLLNGELQQVVLDLNTLLSNDRRNFGYRVAVEMARFVNLAHEQTESSEAALWTALDLAIVQKVLPKFNGTQQELEEVLGEVFVFAITGTCTDQSVKKRLQPEAWHMEQGRIFLNGPDLEEEYSRPRLPMTAMKVWSMWNRLRRQGFTSYLS